MFSGQKKRHNSGGGGASPLKDSAPAALAERGSRQWLAWRCCAQKVMRTWKEWLAAEGAERERRYRCYVCALAEEEQAAAVLRRISSPHAGARPGLGPSAAGCHTSRPRDS